MVAVAFFFPLRANDLSARPLMSEFGRERKRERYLPEDVRNIGVKLCFFTSLCSQSAAAFLREVPVIQPLDTVSQRGHKFSMSAAQFLGRAVSSR